MNDWCGTSGQPYYTYNPYFNADGPANFWYYDPTVGFNTCHMYTSTFYPNPGDPPINRAWWYTDPNVDPQGNPTIEQYQPGVHNSCGSAFFNVRPTGENGPNNSYYVNISGPNGTLTTVESGGGVIPSLGAKMYLGDAQFCSSSSLIFADASYWTWY